MMKGWSMWVMMGNMVMVCFLDLRMMRSNHIRRRTNLASRFPFIWSSSLLRCDGFRKKRCPVAHTVAVPKLPIVPFFLKTKTYPDNSRKVYIKGHFKT